MAGFYHVFYFEKMAGKSAAALVYRHVPVCKACMPMVEYESNYCM